MLRQAAPAEAPYYCYFQEPISAAKRPTRSRTVRHPFRGASKSKKQVLLLRTRGSRFYDRQIYADGCMVGKGVAERLIRFVHGAGEARGEAIGFR
jgi:hypothetical protein